MTAVARMPVVGVRTLLAFAAGVLLTGALAVGITAAQDDSPSASTPAVHVSNASNDHGCAVRSGPC